MQTQEMQRQPYSKCTGARGIGVERRGGGPMAIDLHLRQSVMHSARLGRVVTDQLDGRGRMHALGFRRASLSRYQNSLHVRYSQRAACPCLSSTTVSNLQGNHCCCTNRHDQEKRKCQRRPLASPPGDKARQARAKRCAPIRAAILGPRVAMTRGLSSYPSAALSPLPSRARTSCSVSVRTLPGRCTARRRVQTQRMHPTCALRDLRCWVFSGRSFQIWHGPALAWPCLETQRALAPTQG